MADVSPSGRKVDDFLSSVSQLSQDRFKEDQQRQRHLQRNIDDLQLRLNSTSPVKYSDRSTYGRSQNPEDWRSSRDDGNNLQDLRSSLGNTPLLKYNRKQDTFLSDLKELEGDFRRRDQDDDGPALPRRRDELYDGPVFPRRPIESDDSEGPVFPTRPNEDVAPAFPRRPEERGDHRIRLTDNDPKLEYGHIDDSKPKYGGLSSSSSTTRRDILGKKIPPPKPSKNISASTFDIELLQPTARADNEVDYSKIWDQRVGSGQSHEEPSREVKDSSSQKFWSNTSKPKKHFEIVRDNSGPKYKSFSQIEKEINRVGAVDEKELHDNVQLQEGRESEVRDNILEHATTTESKIALKKKPIIAPKPTLNPVAVPKWVPPNSAKAPTMNSGPMPLFPQNVYYVSPTKQKDPIGKENDKPVKPGKSDRLSTKQDHSKLSSAPTVRPKSDWLSSTLANKATTLNQQGTAAAPPVIPRKKADWLSSSISNSRSTISTQESLPTPRFPQHQEDWISSLAKSKNSTSQASENLKNSPLYVIDKKPTSWIDSALKKSDSHKYIEPPEKATFKIVKKEAVPEVIEPTPELFSKFQTLKPRSNPVISLPKKDEQLDPEYLSRFSLMGKSIRTPQKPNKDYTKEESELLKSSMSRLSPSKSIAKSSDYTKEDSELLKSTMSRLSNKVAPPKPAKPSIEKYTKDEQDLLSSTMARLSPKKILEKLSASGYESNDTELLRLQMKKLGSKSINFKQLERKDEIAEGLTLKLKPVKPEKLKDIEPLKSNLVKDKDEPVKVAKAFNFQDQLSNILRASTAPELGVAGKAPAIVRATSVSTKSKEDKLTHPNKSRAKGPKRRLPKGMDNARSTSTQVSSAVESSPSIASAPLGKKVPPPVNKQNKPLKPSRNFSGEVFI